MFEAIEFVAVITSAFYGILQARAARMDVLGVFTTILGNDFVVLPRFTPPDFASLQSAFAQSAPQTNGHDLSRSWLEEVQGDGAGDEAGSGVV